MFTLGLNAQVYVDADASGSGDGSSWANAYTDLAVALDAAVAGDEIWVADGRYVTPADTSFVINKGISLLGGFNGTEGSADEADADANLTILSGDVNGDDVEGTYDSLARLDNQRVLFVADSNSTGNGPAFETVISGFTIRDGNVTGFEEGFLGPFAGGGLFATGQVTVSDVTFSYNYSDFGSAVALLNLNADNSSFDNITVENNYSGPRWDFYNRNTDNVTITNSTFVGAGDVVTPRGLLFSLDVINFTIEDSEFSNVTTTGRGGAIHVEGTNGTTTLRNVTVDNTSADLGGAIYLRNFSPEVFVTLPRGQTVMENVTITNAASQRWGGAVLLSQVDSDIDGLTITDVDGLQAGGLGGGLYLQSNAGPGELPLTIDWNNINISNVEANSTGGGIFAFLDPDYTVSLNNVTVNNASATGSGGGLYLNGGGPALTEDNIAQLNNVTISNNVANATPAGGGGFGGGSIYFAVDVNITNSTFTNNQGALDGGNGAGVYAQAARLEDGTSLGITVSVSDSEFSGNRALSGSGIAVFGEGQQTTISNCSFLGNGNAQGGNAYRGGALAFFQGNGSSITVDSCQMAENSVTTQQGIVSGGGAIYCSDITADGSNTGTLTVTNSVMESNIAGEDANGGAVYFIDAIDGRFEDTDFIFNSASDGGALASFMFPINDTINNIPMETLPPFSVLVKDALINANNAGNQGGAVSTQNNVMSFTNAVFVNNTVGGEGGGGGAIIFNGRGPTLNANNDFQSAAEFTGEANIVNCTFFGNRDSQAEGAVGNSIALFQPQNPFDDTEQSITLTLQNNAFLSDEAGLAPIEFEPATADPATAFGTINVVSLGGNFFNEANGDNIDLGANGDVFDESVDFEEIFEDPFEDTSEFPLLRPRLPEAGNPLIDAGTTGDLVPDTGIEGNPRGAQPDIGAYELEWSATSVQTVSDSGLDMDFFPNPTVDVVNIRNNDATITDFTVVLTDNNGRILRSQRFNGTVNRLDLADVPTGVYTLQLLIDGNVYSQQVVKQ